MSGDRIDISMAVLGASLCVLLEAAIQICRLQDRRRARQRPWNDLDDDTPSPLPDPVGCPPLHEVSPCSVWAWAS